MIESTNAEKAFNEIHYQFMIKTFGKLEIEGVFST